MTVGKASALAAGFVGALALGVAIGPTVHDRLSKTSTRDTAVTESAPAPTTPAPAARATKRAAAPAPAKAGNDARTHPNRWWRPDLQDRSRALQSRSGNRTCANACSRFSIKGTKLELAAEDFRTAEEFVTVAHAARNTSVPFMVLKHRVLNEGRTLSDAIHEAKPDLDAKAEVARAREAAQADLAD